MKRTRSLIILLFVFMLAGSIAAQSKKDRDAANKLDKEAVAAFSKKNYREMAAKLGEALRLVPTNPDRHFRKGYAHSELKETDDAIREFTLALNQGYKPADAVYNMRAYVYKDAQNYDAALEEVNRALGINPKNVEMLKLAGEINLLRSSYSAALDSYQKAATVNPKDQDVYFHIAQVHFALGDTRAQQDAVQKGIANGTRYTGDAYFLLGDANQKLGSATGAIAAYQRAISAKPDLFLAYRNLSEVFRSEGQYDKAIDVSKSALVHFVASGPEYMGTLYTDVSWYYSLSDQPDRAVAAAKSAVQILPNQPMGYTNLCRAYNDAKSYEDAVRACTSALRLNPGDGETNFYLGRAYNLLARKAEDAKRTADANKLNAEATRYYDAAVKGLIDYTQKNSTYSDGWYLLGNAYFADNQQDKAIEAYLQCLKLSPRFAKARYNLGYIYTLKKNKTAALEQYNGLVNLNQKLAIDLKQKIDELK